MLQLEGTFDHVDFEDVCASTHGGTLSFLELCEASTGKAANLGGATHSTWRALLRATFCLPDAGSAMMAVL